MGECCSLFGRVSAEFPWAHMPRSAAAGPAAAGPPHPASPPSASSRQVRYDKRVGDNTAIKFMTDGILLR